MAETLCTTGSGAAGFSSGSSAAYSFIACSSSRISLLDVAPSPRTRCIRACQKSRASDKRGFISGGRSPHARRPPRTIGSRLSASRRSSSWLRHRRASAAIARITSSALGVPPSSVRMRDVIRSPARVARHRSASSARRAVLEDRLVGPLLDRSCRSTSPSLSRRPRTRA